MKIERMGRITRDVVRANPDKAFLFGDNLTRRGLGGQAKEMRGEPNAFGIATKKVPFNNDGAFMTDLDFESNCHWIDLDIQRVVSSGLTTIVIPTAGLGTGLADLPNRAPRTYAYLEAALKALEDL